MLAIARNERYKKLKRRNKDVVEEMKKEAQNKLPEESTKFYFLYYCYSKKNSLEIIEKVLIKKSKRKKSNIEEEYITNLANLTENRIHEIMIDENQYKIKEINHSNINDNHNNCI